MKLMMKIQQWSADHGRSVGMLRIALGLLFIVKGITFLSHLDLLTGFLHDTGFDDILGVSVSISLVAQLIIILHLLGGACIVLDVRTRFFCILNLPILLGAVLFVNLRENVFSLSAEFFLSILALLTLGFFLVAEQPMAATQTHEK